MRVYRKRNANMSKRYNKGWLLRRVPVIAYICAACIMNIVRLL